MRDFPHLYEVTASGETSGDIEIASQGLPNLATAAPAEFDGPGDRWSPETLLVAAVADCYILTFRAIARASNIEWKNLRCEVTGTLDKVERSSRFTHFTIRATLEIPEGTNEARAHRIMEKAEESCLITNSLTATRELITDMKVA